MIPAPSGTGTGTGTGTGPNYFDIWRTSNAGIGNGGHARSLRRCNFYIHYEVDDDEVPTVLELAAYDGADEGCWVLLQQV